jgi:hypothetical protein
MSQDIGDTCRRSSATGPRDWTLGHAAAHVEVPPGHHRPVRGPTDPCRGRRPLRRAPGLGLQAQGALPGRGRHRARATVTTPPHLPGCVGGRGGRPHRPDPQGTHRRRSGRRPRHHLLAAAPSPRTTDRQVHHQPSPHGGRAGRPRAQEATEALLRPVRGRDAERDLAVRLPPTIRSPTTPTQR